MRATPKVIVSMILCCCVTTALADAPPLLTRAVGEVTGLSASPALGKAGRMASVIMRDADGAPRTFFLPNNEPQVFDLLLASFVHQLTVEIVAYQLDKKQPDVFTVADVHIMRFLHVEPQAKK